MGRQAPLALVALAVAVAVAVPACGDGDAGPPGVPRAAVVPAPAGLVRACARVQRRVGFPVRCPRVLPDNGGGFERPRAYQVSRCSWMLNLEPRGARRGVFHLLVGGRCRPWDLARLPGSPRIRDLGLVVGELRPGRPDEIQYAPRVVRRLRVAGGPGVVLRARPYPQGGIHGDHLVLLHNAGGHGQLVSGHRADVAALVAIAEGSDP